MNTSYDSIIQVHMRKLWQPNWKYREVMALIKMKGDEHLAQ
jgi:hypothetical protein